MSMHTLSVLYLLLVLLLFITLTAPSDKRNVTACRQSVCLSHLFLILIEHAVHTQRDSPGAQHLHLHLFRSSM